MKKLVSTLVAISLCLSLCACGGSLTPNGSASSVSSNDPTSASTEPTLVLQLAHSVAEDPSHPYTVASNAFKEKMEALSGGSIQVDIYPGGQLGGDSDILQGLQLGSISCAVLSSPVIANVTNVMAACDMPFLFNNDYDVLKQVQGGELGDYMLQRLNEEVDGIYATDFLYQAFRHIWTEKPTESLEDLKGIKFRCMQTPIHLDIFSALGTNPTSIAYNEIYSSMQSGAIDGFEMDVFGAMSNKFYEVCQNMTLSGHFNNSIIMIFSKSMYESLTAEQQAWAEEASAYAAEASYQATVDGEARILEQLKAKGVNVIEIDLNSLKEAEEPIIQSYYESVPEIKYVIDGMTEMGLIS